MPLPPAFPLPSQHIPTYILFERYVAPFLRVGSKGWIMSKDGAQKLAYYLLVALTLYVTIGAGGM